MTPWRMIGRRRTLASRYRIWVPTGQSSGGEHRLVVRHQQRSASVTASTLARETTLPLEGVPGASDGDFVPFAAADSASGAFSPAGEGKPRFRVIERGERNEIIA